MAGLSLRPLASAIGSSPRVLLFLFGSKDELIRALLARARADELMRSTGSATPREAASSPKPAQVWTGWRRPSTGRLLILWMEGYARSLVEPHGPWQGFAERNGARLAGAVGRATREARAR